MARPKKKGTAGAAKNFVTRNRALKKLQISLPDFRKLCIFKGIYPREPRKRKKISKSSTATTTYYYSKDIQYLLHEPLIQKFREHNAVSKKIGRALGKGEVGDAARLERQHPTKLSLGHIIKERYPTFNDALRDLDDCISLLFLFADLPSQRTVESKTIERCQRLCHEFQHYVITTHSLRKSFLSIKGIYYQAEIQGEDIMWLVPYKFVQRVTSDVDLRIMGTFVELYTALLRFVNFRLYTTIGLVYPPKIDTKRDDLSGELAAFRLEGRGVLETSINEDQQNGQDSGHAEADPEVQKRVDEISRDVQEEPDREEVNTRDESVNEETPRPEIDKFESADPSADVLEQPSVSVSTAATLFTPYTFFISRESPRAPIEFILKSFGCDRVGWPELLGAGAYTHNESDTSITHQIVDRPPLPTPETSDDGVAPSEAPTNSVPAGYRVPGRIYVQPQWVWDSINAGELQRPDLYAPGSTLPPHLSPWVKPKKGQYDPKQPLEVQAPEGEAEIFAEEEALAADVGADDSGDMETDSGESESDEDIEGSSADEEDLLDDMDGGIQLPDDIDIPADEDDDRPMTNADDKQEEVGNEDDFGGFSDDDGAPAHLDDEALAAVQHQAELEAEAKGIPVATTSLKSILKQPKEFAGSVAAPLNPVAKAVEKKRRQEQEELDRRIGMMSRKKRKTYDRMMFGNNERDEKSEKLRLKRRKLESQGKRSTVS